MNWPDTVILLTGASQGIGRHLARHFAAKGAEVIVTARREQPLAELAQEITGSGDRCWHHVSDLREPATLEALADAIRQRNGKVDILINNAADVTSKPFLDTSPAEIDAILHANLIGCLQLTRLIAPMMVEAGGGAIVNISSLAGYKPNPAQSVYSISKAGVNAISDTLRAELAPKGIHVLNVATPSVKLDKDSPSGGIPLDVYAQKLEQALVRRQDELYFSSLTKWLMCAYRAFPFLARLRQDR